jgi:hypothetical protein
MSKVLNRSLRTAALVLAPLAIAPSYALADHSWGNYHWARTGNPFLLPLGANVSTTWEPYLATASTEWNRSRDLETSIVPGRARPKNCKPTAGRVEVCSERYGFNGWLGIAQIWISGGHITQASTKVNDSYFNTARYNTPGWRNLVMCQEVGHTFGLDHQDENFSNPNLGTCMDYTSNPDSQPINWYPNDHDYAQLEHIYTHLDSGSSVAQAPGTGKAPPASAASDEELQVGTAQWGRLIRSTNRGRTELFELDQGAGRKMFTFVIWADPEDQPEGGPGRGRR